MSRAYETALAASRQVPLTAPVRKPEEWEAGHIPDATHAFLGELRDKLGDLDKSAPYATYCASGFRASIASSLRAAHGFTDIRNVPGS